MKKLRLIVFISLIAGVFTSCQKQPNANFTASKTNAVIGELITFSNTSADADSYEWDFGDGSESDSKNATHSYTSEGSYFVKLTAYSKNGKKKDVAQAVIVITPTGGGEYLVPASGNNTYTTCSGILYDSGGPDDPYGNNQDGYTILAPSVSGNKISLNGTLQSESGCDYLYIYNGSGTSGTILWSGAGNSTIPTVTSTATDGKVTVRFVTDFSVTYNGFELNISCQ